MRTRPRGLAMTKKRASALATAVVLSGGVAAVTTAATPAAAATNTTSHAAAPQSVNYFHFTKNGKTVGSVSCNGWDGISGFKGTTGHNGCNVRVWLHLNANHTGKTECFSPGQEKVVNADYRSLQVSGNTKACG